MTDGRRTRLPRVLIFADGERHMELHSERMELLNVTRNVPTPAELAAADVVLVIGPVGHRVHELAGAMQLALARGATLVFIYPGRFESFDWELMKQVARVDGLYLQGVSPVVMDVRSASPRVLSLNRSS
jgi:hypothetical protein